MRTPRLSTTLVTGEAIPPALRTAAGSALAPTAVCCLTHAETPRRLRSPAVVDALYILGDQRFTAVTAIGSGAGAVSSSVRDLRPGVSISGGAFTTAAQTGPGPADASISLSGFWVGGILNDRGTLRILLEGNADGLEFRRRLLAQLAAGPA
ncbi:hypothetical protein [Actinoplanes sp. URMC 104]|uniref:hypothetical protein n=1 Tax=Actinoplanes sp. URMC 104 TaxID=3423409 RepID=UPI003F1A4CC9